MKGSALIAATAAILAGALVFVFVQFQHGGKGSVVRVGMGRAEAACSEEAPRCLPKTTFLDTTGQAWPPEALADKVVVVNVWATWCRPCAMEIPDLAAVYSRYKGRGVVLLGLQADEASGKELDAFVSSHGINYPIVPMDEPIARLFDYPQALPTTFIYDRRGHMRYGRPGIITADQLESTLDQLLGE
ncbi:MAG TPA: TlpA disulfide reductase family protein [Candidatus Acidoferrum sp.]|nr:TlpA disulfide reductase family protein [Candidatus Acidoferrum sp.]